MFIVVFGIQGSGKGTQAQLLSERLGIPHLSTGQLLRSIAEEKTEEGAKIKQTIEAGTYMTDTDMTEILKRHLPNAVLLDGYPRTLHQAKLLDEIEHVDVVLYIDLTEPEAIRRALARGRSDDTPKAIHKRIAQYHAEADDILEFYRKQGKLVQVNGDQAIDKVFAEVCEKLKV